MVKQSTVWQQIVKYYPVDLTNLIKEYIAPGYDYILSLSYYSIEEKIFLTLITNAGSPVSALHRTIAICDNFINTGYLTKEIAEEYELDLTLWNAYPHLDLQAQSEEIQMKIWKDIYEKYYSKPDLLWNRWSSVANTDGVECTISRSDDRLLRLLHYSCAYVGRDLSEVRYI